MTDEALDSRDGPGGDRADVCLVTGASGFIGGHIATRLVREGYRVRGLVRETSDTSVLEGLGVELARGDLTDPGSLISAARGCRFVVHCGALVSDWATVQEIARINVDGTRNALEASASASVERFLHISSTDVYGYPGRRGIDESYVPTGFSNWYAQTKRAAEAEVRRVERARGLSVVILRPATVYGPRSQEVVGDMARALQRRQMLLIDGGRPVAGLLYVENLVDATVLALRGDAALGEAFNLTDGLEVSWKRFLCDLAAGLGYPEPRWSVPYGVAFAIALALEHGYRLMRRTTGIKTRPLLSRQAVHVLGRDQDFSNGKARERLGWAPRVSYQDGLAETIEWLRAEHPAGHE